MAKEAFGFRWLSFILSEEHEASLSLNKPTLSALRKVVHNTVTDDLGVVKLYLRNGSRGQV